MLDHRREQTVGNMAQLEAHRVALTGHCYRMLGSAMDADDAVQETMVRAWKSIDHFQGQSALRTWLYRIATNVCLDALASRTRRVRSIDERPAGKMGDALEERPRTHWLEPIPDARAIPDDVDPAQAVMLRQSVRLAFVAALQHLPPRQRAVLLLVEVLGSSAAEVAEHLEMSVAAVNSALQRARATLAERKAYQGASTGGATELDAAQVRLVDRYVDAFERYDMDALATLLHDDVKLSMPPIDFWLQGKPIIRDWMIGPGHGCRGSRLLRTSASGLPAFAQYRPAPEGGHKPWALIVLELEGDRIAHVNNFLDTDALFPLFGFPPSLP
jgi:RNA polymerase sigma-70 factor (ECF subfamily)